MVLLVVVAVDLVLVVGESVALVPHLHRDRYHHCHHHYHLLDEYHIIVTSCKKGMGTGQSEVPTISSTVQNTLDDDADADADADVDVDVDVDVDGWKQ